MAEYQDREHYIPLRKSDLVALLGKDPKLTPSEQDGFRRFCTLVGAVWHFEYLTALEHLKDEYAPFDPDRVTKDLSPLPAEKRPAKMDQLFEEFIQLMSRANFKRLSRKDIEAAVEGGASDWGINMHVDWDVFERLEVFSRGDVKSKRTKRHPILFWKQEEKVVEIYQRLILLVKLRKQKRVPETVDTEDVFLKMFKDVPKVDLEMVLPGTSLQMPWSQRYKFGGSLIGTLGYGIYSVFEQLGAAVIGLWKWLVSGAALALTSLQTVGGAFLAPFALLGGYAYKQYYSYSVTKQTYSKMLTESLYYQNLDNNGGVITQILDEAEEQECRETILAYYYLWKYAPPEGWLRQQLDDYVELELEGKYELKVDFEVEDAIAKLEKLGIVTKSGDNYRAVPLEKALERLDYRWDNYFQYNKA